MRVPVTAFCLLLASFLSACNHEQDLRKQIQQNQALLIEKQNAFSDYSYKVTRNSLRIGTNDYDSTLGKDFNAISGAMQAAIDSLQTETDSLEALLPR